jgi:adenosylhomocysteine nucleosidase
MRGGLSVVWAYWSGMSLALIVSPELEELEPVLSRWQALGHPWRPGTVGKMACFEVPSLGLVAAVAGHGKVQLALQCQYLVDRLGQLDALLCVGAAGGLSEQLRLGDIVVAATTVEHDYKLRFVPAELPCHVGTASLVEAFRQLSESEAFEFGVHIGAIASGDEDIVDAARASELRAATGALCVAWEGSGAARVAAFNGLRFVELRCITDGADAGAAASFREHCGKALPNAADLIARWRSLTGTSRLDAGRDAVPTEVTLEPVHRDRASVLHNLFELYVHDFSEQLALKIQASGRFELSPGDAWWTRDDHFPYLVHWRGELAGFALVRRGSRVTHARDVMDVAEFFVLRGARRKGVGIRAAHELFRAFPETWELRVRRTNLAALHFWSRAAESWTGAAVAASPVSIEGLEWHVLRFTAAQQ